MTFERRLTLLNPKFMLAPEGIVPIGIIFDCPACSDHKIRVRFENHPTADVKWDFKGATFEDATITPSIDGTADKICRFHGYITNGTVTW